MDIERIKKNFVVDEPILIDWAVDVLSDFSKTDSSLLIPFEEAILTDECIEMILDAKKSINKSILFERISSHKFSLILSELEERFTTGKMEHSGAWAFLKRLAITDPKKTAEFLETEYERAGESERFALNNIAGLLPPSFSAQFYSRFSTDMLPLCTETLYRNESSTFSEIVKAGKLSHHPEAVSKAIDFILYSFKDSENGPYQVIFNLFDMCEAGEFEFELFQMMATDGVEIFPDVVEKQFSLPEEGLSLATVFGEILMEKSPDVSSLIKHYIPEMEDSFVRKLLVDIADHNGITERIENADFTEILQGAIMALILSQFATDRFEAHLTERDALFLLGLDYEDNPYLDAIINHFKNSEPSIAATYLSGKLEQEITDNISLNIIRVMEALKTDTFIPTLTGFMENFYENGFDKAADKCVKLLSSYGLPTIAFMDEHFETFNSDFYPFVIEIAGGIIIPESEDFLIKYFDPLIRKEKSELLGHLTKRLSERALGKLDHKIGKDQFPIDRLYVVTSILNGKKDDERLPKVLDYVRKEQKRHVDLISDFIRNGDLSKDEGFINLELECGECGDVSDYKVKKVYISGEVTEPYIADEITCIACDRIAEFTLTMQGQRSVTVELLRLQSIRGGYDSLDEDDEYQLPGVIEFMQTSFLGRQMGIHEGIKTYRKRIEKTPGDPENYIGLGNVYKILGKKVTAKLNYKIAMDKSIFHIEPYFNLAQILTSEGNYKEAMAYLEQGKQYLNRPVICKNSQLSTEEVLDGYVDLYNKLIDETDSNKDYLPYQELDEIPVKVKKVGRNEKCPCGSGKKFKKCCMMKQKRAGM